MDPIEINTHVELESVAAATPALPPEALATLIEIGEEINASLDLDDVLRATAVLIKRLINYEILGIMLLDEKKSELFFRWAIGYRKEVVENWRIPLSKGVTGRAARSRMAVRVPDISRDPDYIATHDTVRSELAVPLLLKGKCIGVLDIQSNQLNSFTRDQQDVLTLIASRIAIAIDNARLFESTVRQAEVLRLLNEVSREASSILDVDKLLRRAAELVKRVMDYQIFGIFLFDEKSQVFRQQIAVKYGQTVQEKLEVRLDEGLVGAAARERRAILVGDVRSDPRYILCNPESRSEMLLPLIHQNRVIGVLDVESPQLGYFTEEHVEALSPLAAQLAVSIENARLYQQVARDEARKDRELQAARRIQAAMLPAIPREDYGLEIAARYVPARELGGDLYEFIRYGPQQLAIGLGDVSGKGTAAALYGAAASGIVRSLAPLKLQPAEMLRRVNQFVGEQKVEERFMTLCLATWQRGRMRLRVANAGQSQPLLWKDGKCERIPVVGFPIGIFDDVTYDEWSTALVPGDMVVFYSDGFTESANAGGEMFGVERLAQLVALHAAAPVDAIADHLVSEVARFSGGYVADDRTLLVVKVKQAAALG
jgi:sigma-B regulation protein RsbU (phosphoserine phosphatase)